MHILKWCTVVIVAVIFIAWFIDARMKKTFRKQADAWLEERTAVRESGNTQQILQFLDSNPVPAGSKRFGDIRLALGAHKRLCEELKDEIKLGKRRKYNAGRVNKIKLIDSIDEQYNALINIGELRFGQMVDGYRYSDRVVLNPKDAEWITAELTKLAAAKAARLLAAAENGDQGAFMELHEFTRKSSDTWASREEYIRQTMGKPYETPPNWDELLVRFYENPTVNQFRCQVSPSAYGDAGISTMAAQALRKRNLVVLRYIMVRCATYGGYRAELGDVLYAEIVKMADQLYTELKTSSTCTTTIS